MKPLKLFLALTFVLSACGGGGGGRDDSLLSSSLAEEAYTFLTNGDIEGARMRYDEALLADSDNTTAAFGAAFTRIILLSTSDPSQNILKGLGQPSFSITNLAGPDSYLAALDGINESSVLLDGYDGPFFGKIQTFEYENENYIIDGSIHICRGSGVTMEYRDAANSLHFRVNINLSIEEEQEGVVIGSFNVQAGDSFDITYSIDLPSCGDDLVWFENVETPGKNYYLYNDAPGTIIFSQLGNAEGEAFEVNLEGVTLGRREQLVLNGTLSDTVTDTLPVKSDYFPFYDLFDRTLGFLLSRVSDDLNVADFQSYVVGYQSLLSDITDLLDQADQDNDFQFIIPQGLYFGVEDIPVNRVDLKMLRAGFDFAMAGIYFADSWEYPIDIGSLYDENGVRTVSQEELVAQLNEFFTLKGDHHIDEAQVEVSTGVQNLLDAYDVMDQVTVDGIFEADDEANEGYAELFDVATQIQSSLSAETVLTYFNPAITINLERFFTNPPDASEVDYDPFVLEDDKIKPVEAFFQQMLDGVIDVSWSTNYQDTFSAIRGTFKETVFDEFTTFFVAGSLVTSFGEGNLP